jgi:hypothetical protein
MKVPVSFRTLHAMADKHILVYSGVTDNFIHPKLLKRLGLGAQALDRPRKIWNIDGTTNRVGQLTSFVNLKVCTGSKEEKMCFLVTDLGNEDLILGYPWLAMFEPQFNWRNSVINTIHLPIVVQSLDWRKGRFRPVVARCYDNVRIFHFSTFIYHVYYYSWSHDRCVFISHMTHNESSLGLYSRTTHRDSSTTHYDSS